MCPLQSYIANKLAWRQRSKSKQLIIVWQSINITSIMVRLTWLVHNETKRVRLRKLFALFPGSQKLLFWRRGATPPPQLPTAMHISSISTSAFIKTCDTSVALKLQCLKMQACSLVIISVQSSSLMAILGSGPLRSLHHGSATKLEKSNRFNRLNIWHK